LQNNHKLACAIAAVLSTCAATAHADTAVDASASSGIDEVVVTATRRNESVQDVPLTIQAFTGDQLKQLNVSTFDDAIKLLPNVTFASNGPGTGNIFMRGLSAGFAGNQSSASIASFPNVATYLDDQSLTFPSRNVDVYVVDMERIEVLEGPQGTLFGGGAEAGALRYITNKPRMNVTEGNANATYGLTAGGDPNTAVNATINIPLIQDTLAVRAVIYNDRRGGFIDNVPSTFTRQNTDLGAFYTGIKPVNGLCPNGLPPGGTPKNPACIPAHTPVANNLALAQQNQNPVTYNGLRVSALYDITPDWNLLIAQSYQNMEADGTYAQYPLGSDFQPLKADQVTAFSPAFDKDKFENTAWTLNGKAGPLNLIYTGAYLDRHIDQQADYTNYSRAAGGFYYACTGGTSLGVAGAIPTCYSPVSSWRDQVSNTHQSHEIRVSTPDDWRTRGIVGAFWEDFEIKDNMNFNYKTIPSCTPANLAAALAPGGNPCVANIGPAPGSTAGDPAARGDTTAFGEDLQRGYKQTAVFGSVDYDIIPKVLTVTGGTRWYRYSEFETGSQYGTNDKCVNIPNTPQGCTADTHNIDAANLHVVYTGFRSRANVTWHINPDTMVYYTFSQGYRPGAFNRTQGAVAVGPDGKPNLEKPKGYAPDTLINNEVGLKSEFFDHRVQLNASIYHMNWNNVQVLFFNPTELGNTTFGTNGPNYTVNGLELQLVTRITDGLTVQGSSSWNRTKQTNSPCLIGNIPGTIYYQQCIAEVVQSGLGLQPFNNPFGAEGGAPAFSPSTEFNLRARYDWAVEDYKPFVSVGANHISTIFNQTDTATDGNTQTIPNTTFLRYRQPGYTTYDASAGVAKDNWTAQIYGTNLSNSNASTFTSSGQFIKSEVPLRPRVIGLTLGYKF